MPYPLVARGSAAVRTLGALAMLLALVSPEGSWAAQLLRDINATPAPLYSLGYSNATATLGSSTLLVIDDGVHGAELWQTDGTAGGTRLLKDIYPGPTGSDITSMIALGGRAVFWANDGTNGVTLWVSDGTEAGTHAVAGGFSPAYTIGRPIPQLNGAVYFPAWDTAAGQELWRSDGTAAGTWRVADIDPGPADSAPGELTPTETRLFFTAADSASGRELWVTDGTKSGTRRVRDIARGVGSSTPAHLTTTDGGLYFAADDGVHGPELWHADAAGSDATLVKDVVPGANGCAPREIAKLGTRVVFVGAEGTGVPSGSIASGLGEPFVSDGTAAGTFQLRDIVAGSGADPENLTRVGNHIVFHLAHGPPGGNAFWSTDGTSAGTVALSDLPLEFNNWHTLVGNGAQAWFYARTGGPGSQVDVWTTDGTSAGTRIYAPLPADTLDSGELVYDAGRVYFPAGSCCAGNGVELWSSDGTPAGTGMVLDISPGVGRSNPQYLMKVPGGLVFFADDGIHGLEPWLTDGTAAGTHALGDLNGRVLTAGANVQLLARMGNLALYTADDGVHGNEPWVTDGTASGTHLLADINPGPTGSMSTVVAVMMDGVAYFAANDGVHGNELWRSDGTAAGTHLVADIYPGTQLPRECTPGLYCPPPDPNPPPGSSDPYVYPPTTGGAFAAQQMGGNLYFTADDGVHGRELWRTDGTSVGTAMLGDLTPGPYTTYLPLASTSTHILFCMSDGTAQRLWSSDGTLAGTQQISGTIACQWAGEPAAATLHDRVYFGVTSAAEGGEPWSSDGTAAGTTLLADLAPGAASSIPGHFATIGDRLAFTACTAANDCGLYVSDGSAAGTSRVPGITFAYSSVQRVATGLIYSATLIDSSVATLITDGTASGTRELFPRQLLPNGIYWGTAADFAGRVVFSADDGVRGPAIWTTDGSAAGAHPVFESPTSSSSASAPDSLAATAHALVFAVDDGQHGQELWSIPDGGPSANPDVAQIAFNGSAVLPVLGNDGALTSPLDATSVTLGALPSHGTVSVDTASGAITYAPDSGYSGADEFTYAVRDAAGHLSNAAAVSLFVAAPAADAHGTAPSDPGASPCGGGSAAAGPAAAAPAAVAAADPRTRWNSSCSPSWLSAPRDGASAPIAWRQRVIDRMSAAVAAVGARQQRGGQRTEQHRQRRKREELLQRQAQRQHEPAEQRAGDRADPPHGQRPAHATRLHRRRIEQAGRRIVAELRTEHAEAGQRREPGDRDVRQPRPADRGNRQYRQGVQAGDRAEPQAVEQQAHQHTTDRRTEVVQRARQRRRRRRHAHLLEDQRQPAIEEEVRHQGGGEAQPQQWRDQCEGTPQQYGRPLGAGCRRLGQRKAGRRRQRHIRSHARKQAAQLRTALRPQRQEFDRLGQPQVQQQRDQQRHQPADPEQHGPAVARQQPGGHRARRPATDRDAGEHQHDERGPTAAGHELRIEGDRIRHESADPQARDETQHHDLPQARGRSGRQRGTPHEQQAHQDRHPPPAAIAEPAEERRAEENADQTRGQHRCKAGGREVPGTCQRRRRESHDRKVIAIGEHRQERERQQLEPEAAEALPIDQRLDGERRAHASCSCLVSVARIDPSPLSTIGCRPSPRQDPVRPARERPRHDRHRTRAVAFRGARWWHAHRNTHALAAGGRWCSRCSASPAPSDSPLRGAGLRGMPLPRRPG